MICFSIPLKIKSVIFFLNFLLQETLSTECQTLFSVTVKSRFQIYVNQALTEATKVLKSVTLNHTF